jgi:hypothetical protein
MSAAIDGQIRRLQLEGARLRFTRTQTIDRVIDDVRYVQTLRPLPKER